MVFAMVLKMVGNLEFSIGIFYEDNNPTWGLKRTCTCQYANGHHKIDCSQIVITNTHKRRNTTACITSKQLEHAISEVDIAKLVVGPCINTVGSQNKPRASPDFLNFNPANPRTGASPWSGARITESAFIESNILRLSVHI